MSNPTTIAMDLYTLLTSGANPICGSDSDGKATWQAFVGYMPDQPVKAVCMMDAMPNRQVETYGGKAWVQGFVSVYVRGGKTDYFTCQQKISNIVNAVRAKTGQMSVGGNMYHSFLDTGFRPQGQDRNNRWIWVVGFEASYTKSPII